MKIVYERLRDLPNIVKVLNVNCDAWVVGGAAKYLIGLEDKVRDWDVLVPLEKWHEACLVIPYKTESNTFGGFKVKENSIEIDVWGQSISNFSINTNSNECYLVNPRQQIVLHLNKGYK